MSIVGPRPHAPSTRAGGRLFSEVVSSSASRHRVKPGITGWAQVHGWPGETHTEDQPLHRLETDLYYVENWSLLLDRQTVVSGTHVAVRVDFGGRRILYKNNHTI